MGTIRAGLPTAKWRGGTGLVTTAPAPTTARSPIVTPFSTMARAPINTPRPMWIGLAPRPGSVPQSHWPAG